MLVKHNMSTLNLKEILWWSGGSSKAEYDVQYKGNCMYFRGTKETDNPYTFGYHYGHYLGSYSKFKIKNIGESNLIVDSLFSNGEIFTDVDFKKNETLEISRLNNNKALYSWFRLEDISNTDKLNGVQLIDFMITKDGYSDVYLPNVNTLPEDKQPLLPPEGNYKEIQPQ